MIYPYKEDRERKEDKEWLLQLFKRIEYIWVGDKTIRFQICEIREKGFVVKIGGLYAYLAFACMPWSYPNIMSWRYVFPSLKDKCFYGKVSDMTRINPYKYRIFVDAAVHKFGEGEPNLRSIYSGIVMVKFQSGWLVEIGGHFDWLYGSIVGLMPLVSMKDPQASENILEGDQVSVFYARKTDKGPLFIDGQNEEMQRWYSEEIQKYINTEVSVQVVKKDDTFDFLVDNQYPATVKSLKEKDRSKIEQMTVLLCKVERIDYKAKRFVVSWLKREQSHLQLSKTKIEREEKEEKEKKSQPEGMKEYASLRTIAARLTKFSNIEYVPEYEP